MTFDMNKLISLLAVWVLSLPVYAQNQGYELFYRELENGIEPYISRFSVTENFLRIDDMSEQQSSGYILFDVKKNTVYSVNHQDESTLVMESFDYESPEISAFLSTSNLPMQDAPPIAGKKVFSYRVVLQTDEIDELCTSVQYVPGLLPQIGQVLHAWQKVVSGNQVRILDRTPEEYRTPCMLSDQVYNQGDYYAKGLVIQEWHSNGKQRVLQHYRQQFFDDAFFSVPEGYQRFTLDETRPLVTGQ